MSVGLGPRPAGGALHRLTLRATRARERAAATAQRCDLCAQPLPEAHRHLLDERTSALRCVCRACALLFAREAAGRGHYLLIPDRRVRLPSLSSRALGMPVGLAFLVCQADGQVIAHYPSPIGVTQGEVDSTVWARAREQCEELTTVRPLVEALLVNTARGADEHWIVPIDVCYRLVAVIQAEWRGLSGGSTVWPAVTEFFAALRDGAEPGGKAGADTAASAGTGSQDR